MADQHDDDSAPAIPMTDADITPSSADAGLQVAAPVKDGAGSPIASAKQAVLEKTADARGQAADKARVYAEDGKAKATSALDQLSQMLSDAAGQVDEKLGEQYGQYARAAADKVQGYSTALDGKSVDDLVADARDLVKKSPAVAIGAAAAVGFVIARLLTAGVDQRDA